MKDWILTRDEIRKVKREVSSAFPNAKDEAVAIAEARKIVQRLDGYCQDHWTLKDYRLRDNCEECWEELRKEVGS